MNRWIDSMRRRVLPTLDVDDWQDDLLGEPRLTEVERRPRQIAAAIRDVNDEIRTILDAQRRHRG